MPALNQGRLPDILQMSLKPIIELDEASREAAISEHKQRRRKAVSRATPKVLNRLPYYPESDIEISMPIYKAEYSYPLIVLKRLISDDDTSDMHQRLLILDSDGDMAVIKVPSQLIEKIEKVIKEYHRKNRVYKCAVIARYADGLSVDYIVISQLQRKALDTLIRYFEKAGEVKQPVSSAVKAVLDRAREVASPTR